MLYFMCAMLYCHFSGNKPDADFTERISHEFLLNYQFVIYFFVFLINQPLPVPLAQQLHP